MTFAFGNNARTNLQSTIRNKQQLHKRFSSRFSTTTNVGERTFLKQEINQIVNELAQLAKAWSKAGFGSTGWITNGYTPKMLTSFGSWSGSGRKTTARKTGARKSSARKSTKSGSSSKSSKAGLSRSTSVRYSKRTKRTTSKRSTASRAKRSTTSKSGFGSYSPFRSLMWSSN